MSFAIGQVVGDYEVIGVLGAGGMGSVYKARNLISDRVDALKMLLPDLGSAPDLAERFLHEIRILAGLTHPNIAALHTALRVNNQLLMVMEFVDGSNLDQRLEAGQVTSSDGIRYIGEVLSALEYAHSRGVVHRDIKPGNIAINGQGSVKLLDFGLARATADKRLTKTGMVLGSLFYMSPEQVMGKQADTRSDLYSTGITLYRVLTGRRPIDGESEFAVMRAQVHDQPAPPYLWNKSIPLPLSDVIMRSIEKSPDQRFQTAREFRTALEPFFGLFGQSSLRSEATRTMVGAKSNPALSSTPIPSTTFFDGAILQSLQRILALAVGPIASALVKKYSRSAQSVGELCEVLAEQISSEKDRSAFRERCRTELGAERTRQPIVSKPIDLGSLSTGAPHAWDPAILERCRKLLAPHVGPIAKVIVDRASKKAARLDDLFAILGSEIDSAPAREQFLRACEKAGD